MVRTILKKAVHVLLLTLMVSLFASNGLAFAASGELTALVISDLHFTADTGVSSLIVSGMAFAPEIADTIVAEVIDRHPDVFIMTGDNTNSGHPSDAALLAEKLQKIRDAGISVIMTTGNHDFNFSSPEDYEEAYAGLPQMADWDASSLSYTVVEGRYVFLAMDDNSLTRGERGEFSPETMEWLERMLQKYEGYRVIFLSHHNVLAGKGSSGSESYRIQNEELAPLLEQYGVQLAMTGHLHSQLLLEENGLYELVNTMPMSGEHTMGILKTDGEKVSFYREPIDFATYGSGELAEKLAEKDRENYEYWTGSLMRTLRLSEEPETVVDRMARLMMDFLGWYTEGQLGAHTEDILENKDWEKLIDTLWDYNYGPWMKGLMDSQPLDASRLTFEWNNIPAAED